MKHHAQLIFVFLLLIAIIVLAKFSSDKSVNAYINHLIHIQTVTIDTHSFLVTTAKTQTEQEKGLSGLNSLSPSHGMVFLFDHPDYYGFWMKDMKFPIDIIFIHNKKIVTIYNRVPFFLPDTSTSSLPVYKPSEPADVVLEVSAGLAEQYHFSAGENVDLAL